MSIERFRPYQVEAPSHIGELDIERSEQELGFTPDSYLTAEDMRMYQEERERLGSITYLTLSELKSELDLAFYGRVLGLSSGSLSYEHLERSVKRFHRYYGESSKSPSRKPIEMIEMVARVKVLNTYSEKELQPRLTQREKAAVGSIFTWNKGNTVETLRAAAAMQMAGIYMDKSTVNKLKKAAATKIRKITELDDFDDKACRAYLEVGASHRILEPGSRFIHHDIQVVPQLRAGLHRMRLQAQQGELLLAKYFRSVASMNIISADELSIGEGDLHIVHQRPIPRLEQPLPHRVKFDE